MKMKTEYNFAGARKRAAVFGIGQEIAPFG